MRPSRLGVSGAVWGRRTDDVGSAASTIVDRRGRAGRDENGGRGFGHVFSESVELIGEDLFEVVVEGGTGAANAE